MNIEVYEKKRKESLWAKKKKDKEKDPKLDEEKEARKKELTKTEKLCAEYHSKLDKVGYFNSKAMDESRELYGKFKKINLKLLPESVKAVVLHRLEYIKLMFGLSSNQNIRNLMDSFKPKGGDMGIFVPDREKLEKMAKESKEFKKLNELDINLALQKLSIASRNLQPLTNKGNFGQRARNYLKMAGIKMLDKRVDDGFACKRLRDGIEILRKNLARLYRTKIVLRDGEAPEVASRKRSKRV